ncbi:hypothetical protein HD553DRAFT_345140 [Filobasidium floriforme]|uniref:uncharacterized protein n=1 Tax=Filobasidium floriforme TaxID=5210 RepID=UPI001E8CC62D|nr:uncharacterized protein HD553DRAFT_345140 [Filobasidium floriforme]KAH8080220.1 hypothetical protein HD553DRAFT_345140 [Filobasidium floriforme]
MPLPEHKKMNFPPFRLTQASTRATSTSSTTSTPSDSGYSGSESYRESSVNSTTTSYTSEAGPSNRALGRTRSQTLMPPPPNLPLRPTPANKRKASATTPSTPANKRPKHIPIDPQLTDTQKTKYERYDALKAPDGTTAEDYIVSWLADGQNWEVYKGKSEAGRNEVARGIYKGMLDAGIEHNRTDTKPLIQKIARIHSSWTRAHQDLYKTGNGSLEGEENAGFAAKFRTKNPHYETLLPVFGSRVGSRPSLILDSHKSDTRSLEDQLGVDGRQQQDTPVRELDESQAGTPARAPSSSLPPHTPTPRRFEDIANAFTSVEHDENDPEYREMMDNDDYDLGGRAISPRVSILAPVNRTLESSSSSNTVASRTIPDTPGSRGKGKRKGKDMTDAGDDAMAKIAEAIAETSRNQAAGAEVDKAYKEALLESAKQEAQVRERAMRLDEQKWEEEKRDRELRREMDRKKGDDEELAREHTKKMRQIEMFARLREAGVEPKEAKRIAGMPED